MVTSSPQRGITTASIITIVALVLVGAGATYYFSRQTALPEKTAEDVSMEKEAPVESGNAVMRQDGEAMMTYSGAVLAGTTAPLLDFHQADFDAAVQSGKLVVLYFYANWCPVCREEFPQAQAAFNELTSDQVIGFRVNFNDNQTDSDEQALAREHGVAYQHTKVLLKNGRQILKSPETWAQNRYLTEITNAIAQ